MKLSIAQQAQLLSYIYDAGWIAHEAPYYAYIQHGLIPELERNLSGQFGRDWDLKSVVKLAMSLEEANDIRDSLGRESRAGSSRKHPIGKGRKRRDPSGSSGRKGHLLSKE